jgi:Arc/MetJ-type ribon-helix-helix transcriptional regulator
MIPKWYHFGRSMQIPVRLPEKLVKFIDDLLSRGDASSRAVVVSRALDRERRRQIAERDAEILAGIAADPEMHALATFAVSAPMDGLT